MKWIVTLLALLITVPAWAAPEASILNPSGLPVPRFVSLKSDDVNLRAGPGKRYPIRWHYSRARLPVQIVEEFAHWRKIRDFEGTTGWVHKGIVDGKRTVLVMDKQQSLYSKPDTSSTLVMKVAPGVIAMLKECQPDWCRVELKERKAWIRKTDIWGVTREEVFTE
jgi:SH3-like domain-containing protein